MCLTHSHDGFIQIDVVLGNVSELEFVHQVVIHLFGINAGIELGRVERCDAICQTFLHEVVAHVQVVFRSYGDGHVHRSFPIGVCQHFQHHQFALVKGAFAFQGNVHVFRNFTIQCFWNHHARTLDGFLIQL